MHVFATLPVIEQILLDIVTDGEKGATGSIHGAVYAIRASDPLDDRSYGMVKSVKHGEHEYEKKC